MPGIFCEDKNALLIRIWCHADCEDIEGVGDNDDDGE